MEDRRKISILVPYILEGEKVRVFLQKRTKDARVLPDHFGFFGGGAEGDENPEEALLRETKEELDFVPENFVHFKKYQFDRSIKDIFLLKVNDDFESKIRVLEGQYGKWFFEQEALNEEKFIDQDKLVIKDICNFLKNI